MKNTLLQQRILINSPCKIVSFNCDLVVFHSFFTTGPPDRMKRISFHTEGTVSSYQVLMMVLSFLIFLQFLRRGLGGVTNVKCLYVIFSESKWHVSSNCKSSLPQVCEIPDSWLIAHIIVSLTMSALNSCIVNLSNGERGSGKVELFVKFHS